VEAIVFDIETVPTREENLKEEDWDYIFKYSETEEDREKQKERLSLWALTAHLASVALLNVSERVALVMYLSDEDSKEELEIKENFEEEELNIRVHMVGFSMEKGIEEAERKILVNFWKKVKEKEGYRFVSFNGRSFDSVFLMLRSFALGVKVSRQFIGNRYEYRNHIDLLDLLSFHGQGRKYSLEFVCSRLGIPSPKKDMDGHDVKKYFEEGRYKDIALYNLGDTIATAKIYERFKNTLGDIFGL